MALILQTAATFTSACALSFKNQCHIRSLGNNRSSKPQTDHNRVSGACALLKKEVTGKEKRQRGGAIGLLRSKDRAKITQADAKKMSDES